MAILPAEGWDGYEVRIRFTMDGMNVANGNVLEEVYKGVRRAMANYHGDGRIRARLAQQRNPQLPLLPRSKSSGAKRGAP
jgi:hypothetical protein